MAAAPLPACTCPPENAFHAEDCPHWVERERRLVELVLRIGRRHG